MNSGPQPRFIHVSANQHNIALHQDEATVAAVFDIDPGNQGGRRAQLSLRSASPVSFTVSRLSAISPVLREALRRTV